MNAERPESFEEDAVSDDSDWERRVLCSDGNCIGVIGPDGCCKECGKPFEGVLPERGSREPEAPASPSSADNPEDNSEAKEADLEQADDAADEATSDDSDWDRRILCSDGNCIGVIGPNGRCTECGKPYAPDDAE